MAEGKPDLRVADYSVNVVARPFIYWSTMVDGSKPIALRSSRLHKPTFPNAKIATGGSLEIMPAVIMHAGGNGG